MHRIHCSFSAFWGILGDFAEFSGEEEFWIFFVNMMTFEGFNTNTNPTARYMHTEGNLPGREEA